jgi:NADH:ubiquinone oxidoreductase subunit 2 (subunit N)
MSIVEKLKGIFFRTQKPAARWVNVLVICMSSLLCINCYFIVEIMLCSNNACTDLKITNLAVKLSPFFIVYSVTALFLANYIKNKKDIRVIESDVMALLTVLGGLFIAVISLAIWREVGLNA